MDFQSTKVQLSIWFMSLPYRMTNEQDQMVDNRVKICIAPPPFWCRLPVSKWMAGSEGNTGHRQSVGCRTDEADLLGHDKTKSREFEMDG